MAGLKHIKPPGGCLVKGSRCQFANQILPISPIIRAGLSLVPRFATSPGALLGGPHWSHFRQCFPYFVLNETLSPFEGQGHRPIGLVHAILLQYIDSPWTEHTRLMSSMYASTNIFKLVTHGILAKYSILFLMQKNYLKVRVRYR